MGFSLPCHRLQNLALDDKENALSEAEAKELAEFIKKTLGDRVNEVRPSKRLVESPAIAVESDKFMTSSMRRILKAMAREGTGGFDAKPDLEINPNHPMLVRLSAFSKSDPGLAGKIAEQIYDNARVAAGLLEDPREMLNRVNQLLQELLTSKA